MRSREPTRPPRKTSMRRDSRRSRTRSSSRASSAIPTTRRIASARPARCCASCTATPTPTSILGQTLELGRKLNEPHVQAEALMERGSRFVAQGKLGRGAAMPVGCDRARAPLRRPRRARRGVRNPVQGPRAGRRLQERARAVQGVPFGARSASSRARASTRRPRRSSGSTSRTQPAARRSIASAPRRSRPTTRRSPARRRC